MSEIVAVLVIPAEGDPGGLLAPGRCGVIPAMAEQRHTYDPHGPPGPLAWSLVSTRWRDDAALPLWWDGALVPEAWDRYVRSVPHEGYDVRWPSLAEVLVYAGTPSASGWDASSGSPA